jgi:hypothetical protein
MMRPIPFPGGTIADRTLSVGLNDFLQLTFMDAGYFSHDDENIFATEANLPAGSFEKGSVVISSPVTQPSASTKLSFWDAENKKLWTVTVVVSESSHKPRPKPKH